MKGSKKSILPWGAITLINTGLRHVVGMNSVSQTQSSHQTENSTNRLRSRAIGKNAPYEATPLIFFKIGISTDMSINRNLAEETLVRIDK